MAGATEPSPARFELRRGTLVVTLGPGDVAWRGERFEVDPRALVWRARTRGVLELRLDLLLPGVPGGPGAAQLVELLVQELRALVGNEPLLAACHPPAAVGAAGGFAGTDTERLALLVTAASAGVDAVDLDHDLAALLLESGDARDLADARWVLSSHLDLPPRGPADEPVGQRLERAHRRALELVEGLDAIPALAGRVAGLKLVGAVARIEEALDLAAWARRRVWERRYEGPGLAVFAGGAEGAFTRLLCPWFGADFTYAAARPGGPVPGQPDALSLVRALPGERFPGPHSSGAIHGVLGHPVAGSLSPQLFTRLFERLVEPQALPGSGLFLRFDSPDPAPVLDFAARHGLGLSVTAPHKAAARRCAVNATDRDLREVGVANTLAPATWVREDEPRPEPGGAVPLVAANTDLVGVRAALDALFEGGFRERARGALGRPLVVLGAGGAARAVLAAVRGLDGGAELRLVVLARDPKRAMALAREFGAAFGGLDELSRLEPLVLVHTTTAGSAASPDPAAPWVPGPEALDDLARRVPDCRVLDANYRPSPTPLVAAAHARGLAAQDGRAWFLEQALAQLELFQGELPDGARELAGVSFERVLAEADDPAAHGRAWRRRLVVLVGQRGVGKSTVAELLAARLGTHRFDLDRSIGRRHGLGAGELLATVGERRFRVLEAAELEGRLLPWPCPLGELDEPPPILALGGGAVETPRVRELLADCTVVWLRASPATLAARVAADPTPRPPIAAGGGATDPLAEAEAVAAARDPLYAEVADHAVDTEDRTPEQVAEELARLLGR